MKNSAATRMPCLIATALDLPWPITTHPFTPRSGAPPYSAGSMRRFTARKAPRERAAPSLRTGVRISSSLMSCIMDSARVSLAFSTTLPVKPSMTMTSTLPVKRSCPSTLPMKFSDEPFRTSWTSLVSSLPLVSSSPRLMRPTRGLGVWKTALV